MKLLISPAKTMAAPARPIAPAALPRQLDKTRRLLEAIRSLDAAEAQRLWKCSDALTRQNLGRFAGMELTAGLTPALFTYSGLQYKHLAAESLDDASLDYLAAHLRILSGFYGVLRPLDGITPYRLEMQSRLAVDGCADLYAFWGASLWELLRAEDGVFLNLASQEYAKALLPYPAEGDRLVTVEFGRLAGGRLRRQSTLAKMARGEFVRCCAQNRWQTPEDTLGFSALGLVYQPALSGRDTLVFAQPEGSI